MGLLNNQDNKKINSLYCGAGAWLFLNDAALALQYCP
jgi:hypothetical protein